MIKSFIFNIFITISLISSLSGFEDLDFDGVSDENDKCPQSLFSDLVDKRGCKVNSVDLSSAHTIDTYISVAQTQGYDYTYVSKSFGLSYFYNDIYLSFSNSYYVYDLVDYGEIDGQGDYYISTSYKYKPSPKLSLHFKTGAIIPSNDSNSNKTDAYLGTSSSYKLTNNLSIFGGWTYYFNNNEDSNSSTNKNYYSFDIGSKYNIISNTYLSMYYAESSSSYEGEDNTKFVYLSASYYFDNGLYSSVHFGRELNDNPEVYSSLKMGYFF